MTSHDSQDDPIASFVKLFVKFFEEQGLPYVQHCKSLDDLQRALREIPESSRPTVVACAQKLKDQICMEMEKEAQGKNTSEAAMEEKTFTLILASPLSESAQSEAFSLLQSGKTFLAQSGHTTPAQSGEPSLLQLSDPGPSRIVIQSGGPEPSQVASNRESTRSGESSLLQISGPRPLRAVSSRNPVQNGGSGATAFRS